MLDKKIGVIAPGGACGHFVYALHRKNTFSISSNGDCHSQVANYDFDKSTHAHNKFQKDFIAHWKDDLTARQYYPNHYLISVQPEPYNVILVAYFMTIKATINTWNFQKHQSYFNNTKVPFGCCFYDYTKEQQYEVFSLNVKQVAEYKYNNILDKQYGLDDIFLTPSDNKKIIDYRKANEQHISSCINFVENYISLDIDSSYYTKKYYNLTKKFSKIIDKF